MKRYVTAVLALAMSAALAACGTSNDNAAATEMPAPTESERHTDEPDDNIIDDTGEAVKDLGDGAADVVDDAGNAVEDAGDGVSNAVKDMQ